ncbi:MAG: hypothetical protein J7J01_01285 [Methanophagales archaeon]|nr:hypothetical protein [Methanophagales archaeon]
MIAEEIMEIMDKLVECERPAKRLPLLKEIRALAEEFVAKDARCRAIRAYAHKIKNVLRNSSLKDYLHSLRDEIRRLCTPIMVDEKHLYRKHWMKEIEVVSKSEKGGCYCISLDNFLQRMEEDIFEFGRELLDDVILLGEYLDKIRAEYECFHYCNGDFEILYYGYHDREGASFKWIKCNALSVSYERPRDLIFHPLSSKRDFWINVTETSITENGILNLIKILDDVEGAYKEAYTKIKTIVAENEEVLRKIRSLVAPYLLATTL